MLVFDHSRWEIHLKSPIYYVRFYCKVLLDCIFQKKGGASGVHTVGAVNGLNVLVLLACLSIEKLHRTKCEISAFSLET